MLSVFAFFAVFMKIFDRQNMLIFFKIFNHRWRWLAWFHRFFGAQTNFFVNFIYKNPRKHLQNPWHSYHNFWQPKLRYRHKPDHLPAEYSRKGKRIVQSILRRQMVWFMPISWFGLPKVVVGGPQVLKVFSWIFIYIFHKNMVLGPKKSVKPD